MIRYHGGPVTPTDAAVRLWTGRHALVSFERPEQCALAFEVAQSVLLDNGAFAKWSNGEKLDIPACAVWMRQWLRHPGCAGHFIPDIIDGTEADNDKMLSCWMLGERMEGGIPVWHLHESLDRLERLIRGAEARVYPMVALGSSGEWANPGTAEWWGRIGEAMQVACDSEGRPRCKLHGLRMMSPTIFAHIPLASADSSNVARNIGLDKRWTGAYPPVTNAQRACVLAERIEHHVSAARWSRHCGIQQNLELIG